MLDEPERIVEVDRGGMLGTLSSLPEQLEEGLDLCRGLQVEPPRTRRVVVAGMGGSAIAGDVAASIAHRSQPAEVLVVRGYRLPAFVGPEDLLVLLSYSGNTQETLSVYGEGIRRGCSCMAISSDGQMKDIALARGDPYVQLPRGLPPRGALGYLLAPLVWILSRNDASLLEEVRMAVENLAEVRKGWALAVPASRNEAKQLALDLRDRKAVIYGLGGLECVARRWQTQLNENAKVLAWSGGLPEAAHNEIVGWMQGPDASHFLPIILRGSEAEKEERHLEVLVHLLKEHVDVRVITPGSATYVSQLLELILLGDLVSVYLAVLRGVDPLPVEPIERLKKALESTHS
jgi:glucose/mannose-6-phosphate isomerase